MSIKIIKSVNPLLSAICADAAIRPFQWVQDEDIMQEYVTSNSHIIFPEKNICPFQSLPLGRNSCQADLTLCSLACFRSTQNKEANNEIGRKMFLDWFCSPDCEYQKSKAIQESAQENKYPLQGPQMLTIMRHAQENFQSGQSQGREETNRDMAPFCWDLPQLLLNTDVEQDFTKHEEYMKLITTNRQTLDFSLTLSQIIHSIIKNGINSTEGYKSLLQDIHRNTFNAEFRAEVKNSIGNVLVRESEDHVAFVSRVGSGCDYPDSFEASLHCALKSNSFDESVKLCARTGGGSASRVIFSCAVQSAIEQNRWDGSHPSEWQLQGGSQVDMAFIRNNIPAEQLEKTDKVEDVLQDVAIIFE